jgi:hypothetical protein
MGVSLRTFSSFVPRPGEEAKNPAAPGMQANTKTSIRKAGNQEEKKATLEHRAFPKRTIAPMIYGHRRVTTDSMAPACEGALINESASAALPAFLVSTF